MATYKVIQDIEAEDKLLGPLSLRQFIYAAVAAVCLYLSFLSINKHVPFLLALWLPMALVAGFFAFPWSINQPTEVWALAKIRFLLKPRRRIWDQSGTKELVTITAPKRVETNYSNGLSESEVRSRLKALADTIDTRGWAIKNVNVNLYSQSLPKAPLASSDRLIDISALPREVPAIDVNAADDMLDEINNPTAHHFEEMISASSQSHRQQIVDRLKQYGGRGQRAQNTPSPAMPNDYWFMNQPQPAAGRSDGVAFKSQVVTPGADEIIENAVPEPTADEQALAAEIRQHQDKPKAGFSHLHTIQPLSAQPDAPQPHRPDPAILGLAHNNDLNVATLSRQANRPKQPPEDEVTVTLR